MVAAAARPGGLLPVVPELTPGGAHALEALGELVPVERGGPHQHGVEPQQLLELVVELLEPLRRHRGAERGGVRPGHDRRGDPRQGIEPCRFVHGGAAEQGETLLERGLHGGEGFEGVVHATAASISTVSHASRRVVRTCLTPASGAGERSIIARWSSASQKR